MLDTAIVGGGVCGLALARSLRRRGTGFALFDARSRLGGRILSETHATSGAAIDLGPTWYWPETQPLITHLIAELGLESFPQHDEGAVLHLNDAEKAAEEIHDKAMHMGAWRLQRGMASLVDALARDLPQDYLHLDHELTHVVDRHNHVLLTFMVGGREIEIECQRVVLALPPRLIDQHIRFQPELDDATREAMRNTETWMAAQAKVVVGYDRPFWREKGNSGNAFVTHDRAVLGEIFDACDAQVTQAALGGFLALSPELRASFSAGLPMLMESQMTQVFGPALDQGEQHFQDWATERYTCSTLDHESPGGEHPDVANPLLRRSLWEGRLYLGGAETASHSAGYLEGALDASRRIDRALGRLSMAAAEDEPVFSGNAASLARFSAWVATQNDAAFDDYRQRLNRFLAVQQRDQLTQLAMIESIEAAFIRALEILEALPFDMSGIAVERGRSALMPEVQKPFGELMQTFLDDVIAFNRTSCALSNFPYEHHPPKDYVQTILRDIAAAWHEFSISANRVLLAKASPATDRQTTGILS